MGLFDFFKHKKQPSLLDAIQKTQRLLFPGGMAEQEELTDKLCQKLHKRYDRQYVANNYIFILTCLFMDEDKSSNAIIEKIKQRANNRLSTKDILVIYKFAIENNERLSKTLGVMLVMDSLCEGGTMEDEMPEGRGEFGLTKTNPIPIRGIPENEVYLRKLRLENGNKITWRRIGSCEAPNIPQLIDDYEILDADGHSVCHLYLCPYNKKTSLKRPKGFIFEGEPIKKTPIKPKPQGKILPDKGRSYVVGSNGEPMVVYYRPKSKLFVNRPTANETVGYFLNIRRPLVIDVTGQERVDVPPMPAECDGIILTGYGVNKSTAFIVRNMGAQSMEMPLGVASKAPETKE